MNHTIKIIGLDLDGTAFTSNKEITNRTQNAIRFAISKGVIVMPATGRAVTGLPKEFTQIEGVRYALTSNGASVVDLQDDNKPLYSNCMDLDLSIRVLKAAMKANALVDVYLDGKGYSQEDRLNQVEKYVWTKSMIEYVKNSRISVKDLITFVTDKKRPLEKINFYFKDLEEKQKMWDELVLWDELAISSSVINNMEVNNATANKGDGLINFGKMFDITKEEIMACGDSGNDIDMLKSVGMSVAMGNASEQIKSLADFVTLTNDEDGVAYAIERFIR